MGYGLDSGALVKPPPHEPELGRQFVAPHNRPMRADGYHRPPGPGRSWGRRHFASQELIGYWLLALVGLIPLVMCSRAH